MYKLKVCLFFRVKLKLLGKGRKILEKSFLRFKVMRAQVGEDFAVNRDL